MGQRKAAWFLMMAGTVVSVALGRAAGAPVTAGPAAVGPATLEPEEGSPEGLMDAAVHLVKVARFDEAAAMFQRILVQNPTPEQALRLRDRAGVGFLAPLLNHPKLAAPVGDLLRLAFEAIKANRTSVALIQEAIDRLATPQQADAVVHLRTFGPYAVPLIVDALADPKRENLRNGLQAALTRMPDEAVPAMMEALRSPNPAVRIALANGLGQVGNRLAIPELKRQAEAERSRDEIRVPTELAIRTILAEKAWQAKPAAELFADWAAALIQGEPWAIPPGVSETVPLWTWDDRQGRLTYEEIPRTQYGPRMALRTVERLVAQWPGHEAAYPLWYLATMALLWEAQARPVQGLDAARIERQATLLGLVLGDARLLAGLQAALDRHDARAALAFLQGLGPTVRAGSIAGSTTLSQALTASDRRVRYEAALVLAGSGVRQSFKASDLVVPILADALSQTATREIVAVAADPQATNRIRDALRQAGLVLQDAATVRQGMQLIETSAAVELVIIQPEAGEAGAEAMVRQVRGNPRLVRLPVLVLAADEDEASRLHRTLTKRYPHVGILSAKAGADTIRQAVMAEIEKARGPALGAQVAQDLALRAAQALGKIGPYHPVFSVEEAVPAMIAALRDEPEALRVAAAEFLGAVGDGRSQAALAAVGAEAKTPVVVAKAALSALAAAVQRHGSALTPAQAAGLLDAAQRGDAELTALAARLAGLVGVATTDLPATYRRVARP